MILNCNSSPGCSKCWTCSRTDAQADQEDNFFCDIRDLLIKRGKSDKQAEAIANRYVSIQVKQMIRWD